MTSSENLRVLAQFASLSLSCLLACLLGVSLSLSLSFCTDRWQFRVSTKHAKQSSSLAPADSILKLLLMWITRHCDIMRTSEFGVGAGMPKLQGIVCFFVNGHSDNK